MAADRGDTAGQGVERVSGVAGVTVAYEVWRTHLRGGPDVCIGQNMGEGRARALLAECAADKADGYPAARLDFILVRATTGRQIVTTTAAPSPDREPEPTPSEES